MLLLCVLLQCFPCFSQEIFCFLGWDGKTSIILLDKERFSEVNVDKKHEFVQLSEIVWLHYCSCYAMTERQCGCHSVADCVCVCVWCWQVADDYCGLDVLSSQMDVKTSNFRRVPALPIYGCAQPCSQVSTSYLHCASSIVVYLVQWRRMWKYITSILHWKMYDSFTLKQTSQRSDRLNNVVFSGHLKTNNDVM